MLLTDHEYGRHPLQLGNRCDRFHAGQCRADDRHDQVPSFILGLAAIIALCQSVAAKSGRPEVPRQFDSARSFGLLRFPPCWGLPAG